jgi:F-type H+-transporting ATPase subunit epsilon
MSPTREDRIEEIVSLTAVDPSGSFGILPDAFRRITPLSFGLATARKADGSVVYIALAGGVLYFVANTLRIATSNYFYTSDLQELSASIDQKLRQQEESLKGIKSSLHQLDEEILKRLAEIGRKGFP